jgi:hypothetical protein
VPPTPTKVRVDHAFAIGDSVMLGAATTMLDNVDGLDIDAAVSRQSQDAINILQARRDAGQLGSTVIVHIGNNGIFTGQHFDDIMQVLGNQRRVIFLTLKVPRSWEGPNNAAIIDGAKKYKNVSLIDWRALTANRPDLFWSDGMHLRPEGAQYYTDLIIAAITSAQRSGPVHSSS